MFRRWILVASLGTVIVCLGLATTQQALAFDYGNPPGNLQYANDPWIRCDPQPVGIVKKVVPGLVGAVAGFYLGGHFGTIGRVVGGAIGWWAGNKIGNLLFKNRYYGDERNYPYYYGQQARYCPEYSLNFSNTQPAPTFAPRAPQILDERLTALREAYFKALAKYQETLAGGSEADKNAAKATYEEAYRVYTEAKQGALGR